MQGRPASLLTMATLLAFAACDTQDPLAPGDARFQAHDASPVIVQTTDVFDEFGTGSGIDGDATLTRTVDGLDLAIAAENLVPGHAHTVWWVIFDNPAGCRDDDGEEGCGAGDLPNRAAQATVVNGEGFVADAAGTSAGFQTHLARHDVGGSQVLRGDPKGVDNPFKAEVHIIVRSHGEAESDPADLAAQTSMVAAFCNLPDVGCLDVGVGVFLPTRAPGQG